MNYSELFNKISSIKSKINILENTNEKFKAIEFLEILLYKKIDFKNTIDLKIALIHNCLYNEENLLHFNAFCLIDSCI